MNDERQADIVHRAQLDGELHLHYPRDDGRPPKLWSVWAGTGELVVRYGRQGARPRWQTIPCTATDIGSELRRRAREKLRKGYRPSEGQPPADEATTQPDRGPARGRPIDLGEAHAEADDLFI